MKNLSKIAFTICLSLLFFTCNETDNKLQEEQLIDNSATIEKIINIYDHTIKATYGSNKISEKEIKALKVFWDSNFFIGFQIEIDL